MINKTFIFIGRSGCGKGTQAKLLSEYLQKKDTSHDILYVQSGAEFREFIKGSTKTQELSRYFYETGLLQPEFLAVYMWIKVLVEKYTGNQHIIFDGTPRKYHEAGVLDSIFKFYRIEKPFVFYIDISKDEARRRLTARKRMDDDVEGIEKRLEWFETETMPAIDYYERNHHYVFHRLDGMKPIEEVAREISSVVDIHQE